MISIIDPYVQAPALPCFNSLVQHLNAPLAYHQPSQMGVKTLEAQKSDIYIVLGSKSHVSQDLDWHGALAGFLMNELKAGKAVLGICFGHQLMCHAFGAQVQYFHNDDFKIKGLGSVALQKSFLGFNAGETFKWAVTHKQIVKNLPSCLEVVGERLDPKLANDIVRHKQYNFVGVQAHPEASVDFMQTDVGLTETEISFARRDGLNFIKNLIASWKPSR